MTLSWLNPNTNDFPTVDQARSDGLLAVGGDLTTARLLSAYRQGIFPWFQFDSPILWWNPDPRMVLIPQNFKCSKSLHKVLKRQTFTVTFNKAFSRVIRACAAPREPDVDTSSATWIHPEMITAYQQLHQLGYAHSVECWKQGELVGGLYGIAIDRVFFGESMFSFVSNSSKVALAVLCQHFIDCGIELIDCQLHSSHLASLGAEEIPRSEFIQLLDLHCRVTDGQVAFPLQRGNLKCV